ncbi:unnamed protein product [Chrysoparadoxa australica]
MVQSQLPQVTEEEEDILGSSSRSQRRSEGRRELLRSMDGISGLGFGEKGDSGNLQHLVKAVADGIRGGDRKMRQKVEQARQSHKLNRERGLTEDMACSPAPMTPAEEEDVDTVAATAARDQFKSIGDLPDINIRAELRYLALRWILAAVPLVIASILKSQEVLEQPIWLWLAFIGLCLGAYPFFLLLSKLLAHRLRLSRWVHITRVYYLMLLHDSVGKIACSIFMLVIWNVRPISCIMSKYPSQRIKSDQV